MILLETTFSQEIILLSLTLTVGGLATPAILKYTDSRKENKQRQSRYTEEKQLLLLDAIANALWEWRYIAKKVPYYGASLAQGDADFKKYTGALAAYDKKSWEIIKNLRVAVSKAKLYFHESSYEFLDSVYQYVVGVDTKIIDASEKTDRQAQQRIFLEVADFFSEEVSRDIDGFIIKFGKLVQENK
jgi:hypothetical protein